LIVPALVLAIIAIGSSFSVSGIPLHVWPGILGLYVVCILPFIIAMRRRGLQSLVLQSIAEMGRYLLIAAPGIALPFLIRAAVVEGVATATEVSTIGIAYTLLYGVIAWLAFRGDVQWRRLWQCLLETAALSGAILIIIGTATGMAWALTQSGFSRQLAAAMSGLPGGAASFMAVSIVAFVILGSVLEGIPAIVLFGPLLFPIARDLKIHEVHYAMVVILAMGIGLFAPPFGVGYYAACAIGRVDPAQGVRPIWPYLLALLVGLIVVAAVPWISIGFL
jgi:tripartite ATP-independent transporter DctM subunit